MRIHLEILLIDFSLGQRSRVWKERASGLHASCDFLVENYGARKEARTNEIEGLKNAKAVLVCNHRVVFRILLAQVVVICT